MRAILQRVRDGFDADRQTLAICVVFSFIVRLGSLRVVNNPDAVYKWAAARALFHGSPLRAHEFNHHSARWGVNLPTLAAQFLFGDDVQIYYVPTLALTTLLAALTFLVGKELGGKWIGALAVFLYTPLPALSYLGSQLMPELFQSCYVMGALLALLRWSKREDAGLPWASLAWFCAAYFAKETAFFFLPGLLLALWLERRSLRVPAFYVAGFGAIVALETLAYRLTYGFPWGRASIIAKHHLGNAKMKPPIESVQELLVRYLHLQIGFRELFYTALLSSLLWPLLRRQRRGPGICLLAVCWSFFLASTFALKSIDPPRLAQPLNERYLHAGAPFLALIVALVVVEALPRAWEFFKTRSSWRFDWARRHSVALLAVVCAIYSTDLWLRRSPPGGEHALTTMARYQRLLRAAYAEGLPLVSRDKKRNAVGAAVDLFLSFEQSKKVKVAYLKLGKNKSRKARVLVDGSHPRYANAAQRKLAENVRNWAKEPHVEVSMSQGFYAKRVPASRPPRPRNEMATTR